jgi:hypothetical protein
VVTALDRLVGCREPHGTGPDYDNSRHFRMVPSRHLV